MSRFVIKLGTSSLTGGSSHLSGDLMIEFARQVSRLQQDGHELVLVSSGAIAAGREQLNFPQLPKDIPAKQMLSAVGQPRLMQTWAQLFGIYNQPVAQILITRDDLRSRRRYLNARNTIQALLTQRVVPIINENDTLATEEIRVGDNDNLSALVSNLVDANILIILTDQDGLFDADPRKNKNARLIEGIDTPNIPASIWAAAGGSGVLGVGGMRTKLQAADLARRSGTAVVIASGRSPDVILKVAAGEQMGTRFTATATPLESLKRYILSGTCIGELRVDTGAVRALQAGGSLLPAGVTKVIGSFGRGETIKICDPEGTEVARGLVNYDPDDCKKLTGKHSGEIESILGYYFGDEIIHRNNLVLV